MTERAQMVIAWIVFAACVIGIIAGIIAIAGPEFANQEAPWCEVSRGNEHCKIVCPVGMPDCNGETSPPKCRCRTFERETDANTQTQP